MVALVLRTWAIPCLLQTSMAVQIVNIKPLAYLCPPHLCSQCITYVIIQIQGRNH